MRTSRVFTVPFSSSSFSTVTKLLFLKITLELYLTCVFHSINVTINTCQQLIMTVLLLWKSKASDRNKGSVITYINFEYFKMICMQCIKQRTCYEGETMFSLLFVYLFQLQKCNEFE